MAGDPESQGRWTVPPRLPSARNLRFLFFPFFLFGRPLESFKLLAFLPFVIWNLNEYHFWELPWPLAMPYLRSCLHDWDVTVDS